MNQVAFKKCVPLFLALLLIFSACTGNLGVNDSSLKSEQLIPMDQLDDLTLKIYFDSPRTGCITYPRSQEQLVRYAESNDQVIVVDSAKLLQHVEMLEQLNTVTLSPMTDDVRNLVSLCYVFETGNGESVFELVTNHYGAATAWVNGKLVANRKIFYEIIYPFLTEEALQATGIPQNFYSGE